MKLSINPTPIEEKLIEEINKHNSYEFSLIRITPTMLGKYTIDASAQIRDVLAGANFVNYNFVVPGGEKIYKKSIILSKDIYERGTSFFRPKAKDGDPRFWISCFGDLVAPETLVYFTVVNKLLVVIPLTELNDFKDLLSQVFRDIETERVLLLLKEKLVLVRDAGWIRSVSPYTNAPKDVGETLEKFLGIPINNLKTPDFLGKIELKSKRVNAGTKDSLFSCVPDWDISEYKSLSDIVKTFGYFKNGEVTQRLYNDIKSKANLQGLFLAPDDTTSTLFQNYSSLKTKENVCAWRYETLKERLYAKHPSTLWVGAEERVNNSNEQEFMFTTFELTSCPLFAEFITLIKTDKIVYDWKAKITDTGKVRNHGPGFRIIPSFKKHLFKDLLDLT